MLTELFTPTIPSRVQLVAIVGSLILLAVVISLIRSGKLKEGYSIIWFLIGVALVVLSTVTKLLDVFANAVGITYAPAALLVVLTGGLFLLGLHFSVLVSKHERRIRDLAQEIALLAQRSEGKNE